MLSDDIKKLRKTDELAEEVMMAAEGAAKIEGVTLQGGEPMIQARNLALLLQTIKEKTKGKLSVLLFTGYTLEQLQACENPEIEKVLNLTDTMIDGWYDRNEPEGRDIRGSTNQNIIHFTPKMQNADFSRKGRGTVLTFGTEMLRVTGIDSSSLSHGNRR